MSNPFKVGARVASTTMPGVHGTVTARHGDDRVAVRWDGSSGFIQHEEQVADLKPSRRRAPKGQADRDDVLGFSFVLLDAARVRDL